MINGLTDYNHPCQIMADIFTVWEHLGDIDNPKIYGAGLLSSVSESENCLKKGVKKIPFSLDCLNYNYDITEQQPQLFVTTNYKKLSKELKKLSRTMSYKIGGQYGIKSAIKAKTVCSIEIDNSIQVSGIISNYISTNNSIQFIKLNGPCQISIKNKQVKSHGCNYHLDGYSSPIGKLYQYNKSVNNLSKNEIIKK